jgi:hypothetical protein
MRAAILIGLFVLFTSEASAQFFCSRCGCKGGSGWRHNETGKCIGCEPELAKRCGKPATEKCTFEGSSHLARIKRSCRNIDQPPAGGLRPLK